MSAYFGNAVKSVFFSAKLYNEFKTDFDYSLSSIESDEDLATFFFLEAALLSSNFLTGLSFCDLVFVVELTLASFLDYLTVL